ncbi:MAG: HD domain-containing protein [Balneolaceae bacterium]
MQNSASQSIINKTAVYVKKELEGEGSGHDWWHIKQVWDMARRLSNGENVNLMVVELAALLHDIADHKFHGGDATVGPKVARAWLESIQAEEPVIAEVCEIIKDLSYKGAGVETPMRTLEGKIVQDADRLNAIGAIGIARAFAYGGYKKRELYNPDKPPVLHSSFTAYKNDKGSTINHFYEKLFLLKDRLNTAAAKEIAEKRHQFMETFVQQFLEEWEGNS